MPLDSNSSPPLAAALEQSAHAVIITKAGPLDAPEGPPITYVNPAFCDITGYDPDEVLGRTPRLLQGPDTEPWVLRRLRARLEQGRPFEGEAINYRKDGTPYVNHWSVSPIRDDDGTLTHWLSIQRDVTEARRTDEALLEAQEREHKLMARRMHDEMGALLTSLQMATHRVRSNLERSSEPALSDLESTIDSLSKVVRTMTGEASSRVLSDFGLPDALTRLAETMEERYDLTVQVHNEIASDQRLSPLLERIVYRIAWERLQNVGRHADAGHAQVLVHRSDPRIRIHIISEGGGLAGDVPDAEHGLTGIRERVDRLNGSFSVRSTPGGGTRLTVTLPLRLVTEA